MDEVKLIDIIDQTDRNTQMHATDRQFKFHRCDRQKDRQEDT